jgi:hypothetical protein
MTAEGALFYFLSGFGIPAYADSSVPDDAEMPYLTYELSVGDWYSGEVNVPVRLWYRTTSEAVLNAKVREMSGAISLGGSTVPCDGGILWIKRGSPWAQSVTDEDKDVKSRYLNLDIEYLMVE